MKYHCCNLHFQEAIINSVKWDFFPTSALYEILQFKIDTPHVSKWCGLSISIHTHTKSGGDHAATQDGVEGQKRCSFQEIHTAPLIVCKNSNEWKFHKCVICVNFYQFKDQCYCYMGFFFFRTCCPLEDDSNLENQLKLKKSTDDWRTCA